jgi:hypothetical protein
VSCFTRVKTRLTDDATIRRAVSRIGYEILENARQARGWSGQKEKADFVIGTRTDYDIGAVKSEGGAYDFFADWPMAHVDKDEFVGKLSQSYSYLRVVEVAKRKGFVLAKEEASEKGGVRLLLRRFS